MRNKGFFFLAIIILLIPAFVHASSWEFRVSPYVWLAGAKGEVGAFPGLPSAPLDLSAKDAFQDTEVSFMVIAEAKKNRHGFFLDFVYTDVASEDDVIEAVSLVAESETQTFIITPAYEYEVYREDGAVVDVLIGIRYWDIDSTFSFVGGLGVLDGLSIDNDESWIDPFIGMKGRTTLGGTKLFIAGGGGIGGFGVGSDLFYDLALNIGYQFNKTIGLAVGYRLFDVEYEDGGFLYDVKQQGWQTGVTFSF